MHYRYYTLFSFGYVQQKISLPYFCLIELNLTKKNKLLIMNVPVAIGYNCSDGEHHFHHYAALQDANPKVPLKWHCARKCIVDSFR